MKKPKFTPGPWWVLHDGSSEVSVQSDENFICRLNLDPIPKEEVKRHLANARLIAAAPELYDALETMVNNECRRSCGKIHPCKTPCYAVKDAVELLLEVRSAK